MNLYKFVSSLLLQRKPYVYVAIGDSTVEGVGASAPHRSYAGILHTTIKEKRGKTSFYNLGIAGATVADVIKDQLDRAISLQPDLITLSIGANDIKKRKRTKTFEKELKMLLEELHTKTDAKIIINTIPDLSLTPAVPRYLKSYSKYMAIRFNKIIHRVGDELSITIVDLFNYSRSILKQFPEAVADDGFHPSDFGYAIWANTMIPHVHDVTMTKKKSFLPF